MIGCLNMEDDYEFVQLSTKPTEGKTERVLNYADIQFKTSAQDPPIKPWFGASQDQNSDDESVIYSEMQGSDVYVNILAQSTSSYDSFNDSSTDYEDIPDFKAPAIPDLGNKVMEENVKVSANENESAYGEYCHLDPNKKLAKQTTANKQKKRRTKKLMCTDITTLEDGRMVVVTESGEIIVLSSKGMYLFMETFDGDFENCTALDKNEIIAACGYRIRFFSVHDTEIREEEEKCIDFQYDWTTVHGISYSDHKLLMSCNLQSVACSQPPTIKLYDMKRKHTKTVYTLPFTSPGKVLLNPDLKKFFVADQAEKTITCVDFRGKLIWESRDINTPISFTLADEILAVAFEERQDITCFSSENGTIVRTIKMDVGMHIPTKRIVLANNTKEIIICPSDRFVEETVSFVFFAPIKHTRKQHLKKKISSMKLLPKMFRK
ncbi:uncharacterized protein LOC133205680 [Saccostrea echinata]|uniref:uncharacterized protein LOC133205680 n=1 Tax=Saccostrea echinata TaxID=191078 RepID=UPI002A814167|nr:uncharacterized protein LOC133205680 [Saccostrea echinata]